MLFTTIHGIEYNQDLKEECRQNCRIRNPGSCDIVLKSVEDRASCLMLCYSRDSTSD